MAGAEVSAPLVLGAMTEIGTAMTVVGAVTGNKSLMKIGGVLGIVGGVGGMINGAAAAAGSAIDASGTAIDASGQSVGTANALSDSSYQGANWDAVNGTSGSTTDIGQAASDAHSSLAEDAANTTGNVTGTPMTDASTLQPPTNAAPGTSAPASAAPVSAAPSTTAPGAPPSNGVEGVASDNNGLDVQSDATTQATYGQKPGANWSAPQKSSDYFGNLMTWVHGNQQIANGVLQLGGGALKGMAERQMFDQKLKQQQQQFQTLYGHANEVGAYKPLYQQAQGG